MFSQVELQHNNPHKNSPRENNNNNNNTAFHNTLMKNTSTDFTRDFIHKHFCPSGLGCRSS
jgi:hypothetical protein